MANLVWWSDGSGLIELQMSREDADSVSQPGKDASEDIKALRASNSDLEAQLAKIKPCVARLVLGEYGAWDENDLADHDANLMRIVWLAGGDIRDGQCDSDDVDPDPPF